MGKTITEQSFYKKLAEKRKKKKEKKRYVVTMSRVSCIHKNKNIVTQLKQYLDNIYFNRNYFISHNSFHPFFHLVFSSSYKYFFLQNHLFVFIFSSSPFSPTLLLSSPSTYIPTTATQHPTHLSLNCPPPTSTPNHTVHH